MSGACEALDAVLASAPGALLAPFEEAAATLARAESVRSWVAALRDGRIPSPELPPPTSPPLAERVAAAWQAVRETGQAVHRADALVGGRDEGSGAFERLATAREMHEAARAEYLAAAELVAVEVEGALPALREAKAEALAVVLAADVDVLDVESP